MKLFYAPGACSLSPHIVLRELGIPFELDRIDGKTHKTSTAADFYAINPKGQVPTLQLDDGQVLTEGAVIVQYLGDRKPEAQLIPSAGTMERYRAQEWLNFIATELHKTMSPLFNAAAPEETKKSFRDRLVVRFELLNKHLAANAFLMGAHFSAADAYLYTVMRWTKRFEMDLARWPSIQSFMERVQARPAVAAALEAEGLT
jgi:glutathione S-transferase